MALRILDFVGVIISDISIPFFLMPVGVIYLLDILDLALTKIEPKSILVYLFSNNSYPCTIVYQTSDNFKYPGSNYLITINSKLKSVIYV